MAKSSDGARALPVLDEIWSPAEPAAGEQALADAMAAGERAGDTQYQAEALALIARAQGLQRRFDEAHATLDRARALLREGMSRGRVRYLLERGRVFNSAGTPATASPLFIEAWELARAAQEDRLAVDAAHMVAIASAGDPRRALEWNLLAVEHAERSAQPGARRWMGSLYNNIGWTYFDMEEHETALEFFQKALRWRQEQGALAPMLIARWSVARVLRALQRVDEALALQQQLLEEYARSDLGEDGFVYEELGECHLALGMPGHAEHFAKAHDLLSKDEWFVANEAARLARIKQLAGR